MSGSPSTISMGGHVLQTPVFFASYRLGDHPSSGLKCLPWRLTRTEAVLINAYDFTGRKHLAWLNNGWCLEKYLKLARHPVLIDSGAYYFRKHEDISVTPQSVLEIEIKSKAHVGVVLDHPFAPESTDKAKRIRTTIANTETMLRALLKSKAKMGLMAAIHGHTKRSIRSCVDRLRRIEDKYSFPLLDCVGIGSLAPLAQRGKVQTALEIISFTRSLLPDSRIHCFSMGSALLMLMAFYAGANSVDSQSWMVSAGFKLAQLPGHYVTRMGKREYRSRKHFAASMDRFANRLGELVKEEGFFVKDWQFGRKIDVRNAKVRRQYVHDLVDLKSNEHVHNRACHNLWVYNSEVRRYREAAKAGCLDDFIALRLEGTRYDAAFQFLRELKRRSRSDRT